MVSCWYRSYCGQDHIQGRAQALRLCMFPPEVEVCEAFRKVTLTAPRVASEASEVKSWTSVRDAIRSTPGSSPPRLGGKTGRDERDACVGKGQTKSDQEGKAFGVTSVYTPI